MKLTKLNPVTSGQRHQINLQKNLLSKTNKLLKNSILGVKQFSGRSASNGRITVRHKGGACKANFRKINFLNMDFKSVVICIMYDPKRNSFISLNFDLSKKFFFRTISTNFVYPGSLIACHRKLMALSLGNRTLINHIPTGALIHSVTSLQNLNKTCFARSAGTFCQIIQKGLFTNKIRLPSGVIITVPNESYATIGVVSNALHNVQCIGKAGRNRFKGIRPSVRGIAMNPVDHPHGGRTNGGMPSVTPWGIPTKGKPTVKKK